MKIQKKNNLKVTWDMTHSIDQGNSVLTSYDLNLSDNRENVIAQVHLWERIMENEHMQLGLHYVLEENEVCRWNNYPIKVKIIKVGGIVCFC